MDNSDKFFAESNTMVAMTSTVSIQGTAYGGVTYSLLKKVVKDGTFFIQEYSSHEEKSMVLLAPKSAGDITILDIGINQYMIFDRSYLASSEKVILQSRNLDVGNILFTGMRELRISETSGYGQLAINGFGSIREITIQSGKEVIVDPSHIIAWESSLNYKSMMLKGASNANIIGQIVKNQTNGEGLVLYFSGKGKIFISSRKI